MLLSLFPENISTYGGEIDYIFYTLCAIVLPTFILSLVLLIYPLIRYNHRFSGQARYVVGATARELKWVILAITMLAIGDFYVLFVEHNTWDKIEQKLPAGKDYVEVGVTGKQWNWKFHYPGPDGKLFNTDDVVVDELNSSLHVPVNTPVVFYLRAQDVLHSFFIPNARLKQDVIPGRTIKRWIEFTKQGKYELNCAELCGLLHSKMRNYIFIESREDYNNFIAGMYPVAGKSQPMTMTEAK